MITIKKNENRQINNTPYYNDALAYDFEMFMPKEKRKPKDNIVEYRPKTKTRSRKKTQIAVDRVSVVLGVFCCVAILASLYIRVEICETSSEINRLNKEIISLNAEKARWEYEYEKDFEEISFSEIIKNLKNRPVKKCIIRSFSIPGRKFDSGKEVTISNLYKELIEYAYECKPKEFDDFRE